MESEAPLSVTDDAMVGAVRVRQQGPAVSVAVPLRQTDIAHYDLIASAPDGTDIALPRTVTATGVAFEVDLSRFAGSAGPWTIRLRRGARWVAWAQSPWDIGVLEPWSTEAGLALMTVAGLARPTLAIVTAVDQAGMAVLPAHAVRSRRGGLAVDVTVLVGPHGEPPLAIVLEDRARRTHVTVPAARVQALPSRGPWSARRVRARVPWDALVAPGSAVWDVSVRAAFATGPVAKRIKAPTGMWRLPLRSRRLSEGDSTHTLEPRYSFKARALAVVAERVDTATWRELRQAARRAWLPQRRAARPLWLVGELPHRAQENGLALFRHVRQHHPEIDARYVITADAPQRGDVEQIGPVIIHGSVEHARAVFAAERVVSTHHPDYLYPMRTTWMRARVRAVLVFIQHGVLGAKWVADLYGARATTFATDLFLVSSPRERDIVVRDFGYRTDQVAVTGLPRFDALLDGTPPTGSVLVMPTWRPWLTDARQVADSDFARNWSALLSDSRVVGALAGREIVVVAHPNLAHLIGDLHLPGVRVAAADESVQDLLKASVLLVTDYSSVGIDAALAGRAVVYFQFDRPQFLGAGRAHVNLNEDLPGRVALNHEGAVSAITATAAAGFAVDDRTRALAATYFPAADTASAERVFQAVLAARRTRPGRARIAARAAVRRLAQAVRRSRLRVAVVRAIYEAARLTPLRRDAVLFEASFGRQYGDSPKAIYQELRRAHPELRATWVGAAAGRVRPEGGARVIGRLGPKYAWHLATSGALVSNQSLPHWIRRRRRQLYVQTWHGTPPKRMLHDLDAITGRDAGYVHRATAGAAQWGVLLSPNPHTTRAMASAFRHHARVLELGYPRNDIFYASDAIERAARVRELLGVPPEHALVLHAPTFRDEGIDGGGAYVPTEAIDLAAFAAELGDRATLVLRRHILDTTPARIPPTAVGCVVDATDFPDAQDLLLAADVLVTDYSSLAFDFLNTRRPCIFFAPDLHAYRDRVRGFYLGEADLPGPVVGDQQAFTAILHEALDAGSIAGYDLDALARRYCPADDGHATARVVAELFGGEA